MLFIMGLSGSPGVTLHLIFNYYNRPIHGELFDTANFCTATIKCSISQKAPHQIAPTDEVDNAFLSMCLSRLRLSLV